MRRERHADDGGAPARDLSEVGFWAGYLIWLRLHRRRLWLAGALLVVVFLAVLIASRAPQDPFSYDLY